MGFPKNPFLSYLHLMSLLHSAGEIYNGEEHENNGLNDTYQNAQKEDRKRCQKKSRKRKKDTQDLLFTEDITN